MEMTRWPVATVAYLGIGVLFYCCVSLLLLVAPIVANAVGYGFENPYLRAQQQSYYVNGPMRSIWQADAGCSERHQELGYTAKKGPCEFSNSEFHSELRYSESGWFIPVIGQPVKPRLLIIGDSQAMGWGVNYDRNFAYLMAEMGYVVNNYAISSYATEQQLLSVIETSEFAQSYIVIIQYCENDMDKNKRLLKDYLREEIALHAAQQTLAPLSTYQKWVNASHRFLEIFDVESILLAPVKYFESKDSSHTLAPYSAEKTAEHKVHLMNVLMRFPTLRDKRVLIFYSNSYGRAFANWNEERNNIRLVDLGLARDHYYSIDDHLNAQGHQYVANELNQIIATWQSD